MANYSVIRTGDLKTDRNFDLIAAALNPALATLAQLSQGCFMYATSASTASGSASVFQPVPFDTAVIDTDGAFQVTTRARFVCPATKPGYYHVSASVGESTAASGRSIIMIYVNGSEVIRGTSLLNDTAGNSVFSMSGTVRLGAGDYVEIRWKDSTANALAGDPNITWVTIFKIPSAS